MVFSEEVGGVKFGHKGTLCPGDQDRTTSWFSNQNWCIKDFHNQSSLLKVNHLYLGWYTCWFVRLLVAHLDTTFFCLKEKNIEGQNNWGAKQISLVLVQGKCQTEPFPKESCCYRPFLHNPCTSKAQGWPERITNWNHRNDTYHCITCPPKSHWATLMEFCVAPPAMWSTWIEWRQVTHKAKTFLITTHLVLLQFLENSLLLSENGIIGLPTMLLQ